MDPITLALAKRFGPYVLVAVLAGSAAFSGAWYVQGLRVTSAKQELKDWKQKAEQQALDEQAKHQKLNEETHDAWIQNLEALRKCYVSGPCKLRVAGSMPSGGVSNTSGRVDGPGADAIPPAERVAAQCAETTLQLNQLQGWVEKVGK